MPKSLIITSTLKVKRLQDNWHSNLDAHFVTPLNAVLINNGIRTSHGLESTKQLLQEFGPYDWRCTFFNPFNFKIELELTSKPSILELMEEKDSKVSEQEQKPQKEEQKEEKDGEEQSKNKNKA